MVYYVAAWCADKYVPSCFGQRGDSLHLLCSLLTSPFESWEILVVLLYIRTSLFSFSEFFFYYKCTNGCTLLSVLLTEGVTGLLLQHNNQCLYLHLPSITFFIHSHNYLSPLRRLLRTLAPTFFTFKIKMLTKKKCMKRPYVQYSLQHQLVGKQVCEARSSEHKWRTVAVLSDRPRGGSQNPPQSCNVYLWVTF